MTVATRHFVCEGVGHTFAGDRGRVEALHDVSFAVEQHEFICVVGPSGCGKSTLLRIIAGLEPLTTGRLTFDVPTRGPASRGCLVVQEHGTFPWLTAAENVAFGLAIEGMPRAERHTRALAFLERVGLSAFAGHYPYELSVGMRQRLGLGRAIVTDASLLLMDEPFAALDAQSRRHMQSELLGIWAADRRTVVFVTHDIDEAVVLADRVLVMSSRPGHILADIRVPLSRPRDRHRDHAAARDLVEQIWDLLGD